MLENAKIKEENERMREQVKELTRGQTDASAPSDTTRAKRMRM